MFSILCLLDVCVLKRFCACSCDPNLKGIPLFLDPQPACSWMTFRYIWPPGRSLVSLQTLEKWVAVPLPPSSHKKQAKGKDTNSADKNLLVQFGFKIPKRIIWGKPTWMLFKIHDAIFSSNSGSHHVNASYMVQTFWKLVKCHGGILDQCPFRISAKSLAFTLHSKQNRLQRCFDVAWCVMQVFFSLVLLFCKAIALIFKKNSNERFSLPCNLSGNGAIGSDRSDWLWSCGRYEPLLRWTWMRTPHVNVLLLSTQTWYRYPSNLEVKGRLERWSIRFGYYCRHRLGDPWERFQEVALRQHWSLKMVHVDFSLGCWPWPQAAEIFEPIFFEGFQIGDPSSHVSGIRSRRRRTYLWSDRVGSTGWPLWPLQEIFHTLIIPEALLSTGRCRMCCGCWLLLKQKRCNSHVGWNPWSVPMASCEKL